MENRNFKSEGPEISAENICIPRKEILMPNLRIGGYSVDVGALDYRSPFVILDLPGNSLVSTTYLQARLMLGSSALVEGCALPLVEQLGRQTANR